MISFDCASCVLHCSIMCRNDCSWILTARWDGGDIRQCHGGVHHWYWYASTASQGSCSREQAKAKEMLREELPQSPPQCEKVCNHLVFPSTPMSVVVSVLVVSCNSQTPIQASMLTGLTYAGVHVHFCSEVDHNFFVSIWTLCLMRLTFAVLEYFAVGILLCCNVLRHVGCQKA